MFLVILYDDSRLVVEALQLSDHYTCHMSVVTWLDTHLNTYTDLQNLLAMDFVEVIAPGHSLLSSEGR